MKYGYRPETVEALRDHLIEKMKYAEVIFNTPKNPAKSPGYSTVVFERIPKFDISKNLESVAYREKRKNDGLE